MQRVKRVTTVSLLVITAFNCALYLGLDQQRKNRINKLNTEVAERAADWLVNDLELRIDAIERLGHHRNGQETLDDAGYGDAARLLLQDFPGLNGLSLADKDFILRKSANPNSSLIGQNIAILSPERVAAIERARDSLRPVITNPISFPTSPGTGFIIYVPIVEDNTFYGTMNAVFNVDVWINHILFTDAKSRFQPDYFIKLEIDGETLMMSSEFGNRNSRTTVAQRTIFGKELRLSLIPKPNLIKQQYSWGPELLTALFASVSVALLSIFRVAYMAKVHSEAEKLARSNEELKEQVNRRVEAEKDALQASEAKSRFLATMSHEIRTPINSIMGLFELLERSDIPERQINQAKHGRLATKRLHELLTNAIDASRLDFKMLHINRTEVSLPRLVEQWKVLFSGSITRYKKNLKLSVNIDLGGHEFFWLDELRTTQIVGNLVDNAAKFCEEGSVGLSIRRIPPKEPNLLPSLEILVSDTGPGIPEDKWQNIFTRFYQVNDGMSRAKDGSGLGMAISFDIAELMSATLEIRESSSSGTTFALVLPEIRSEKVD